MNVWIASDIHGSALYCRKLLDLMEKRGADRLVLLGDLLYHGPRNDLPEGYDPKAVFAMLNSVKDRILCVHGNCDAEVDQMVLHFPIEADFRVEELCGRRLFLTHGGFGVGISGSGTRFRGTGTEGQAECQTKHQTAEFHKTAPPDSSTVSVWHVWKGFTSAPGIFRQNRRGADRKFGRFSVF